MEILFECYQQIPWIPLLVTTFRNFPLSFSILHTTVPLNRVEYFLLLQKKIQKEEEK